LILMLIFSWLKFDQFNSYARYWGINTPHSYLIHKVIHSYCGYLFAP